MRAMSEPGRTAIRLRLATPGDAAACLAVYAPFVRDTAISFEAEPPDVAAMAGRIAKTIERTPWVVAEIDGMIRGYAYAGRWRERAAYDWTAESAVYVDRDFAGRGLGRATMTALVGLLRHQGFHSVVAGITPPNPGSVALHAALGFRRVGLFEAVGWKFNAWHGVEWFELELGERGAAVPITPLPGIRDSAEVRATLEAAGS